MSEKTDEWNGSDIIFVVAIIALFVIGFIVVVFVFNYAFYNTESAINRGPWGDFIGGTLNPLLTFLSFMGILVSIFLQRVDLSLSRRELERSANALEKQIVSIETQNFEVAFFQMLATFNTIVEAIDLYNTESGQETRGRDCFRVFYRRFNKIFRDNEEKSAGRHKPEQVLKLSYFNYWKDSQQELGHYYRILYNIFRFLDESAASKPYHAKLLRAQLSDQELLLLFYNCVSENGKCFQYYAIKYELFDNLPTVRLLEDSHINLFDRAAFGDNPMYNSRTIRSSY